MKAEKQLDWLYRSQIANLPVDPPWVRTHFKKWWKEVCKNIDKMMGEK